MKILNTSEFREKLDIKPADLDNFEYISPKKLLITGDIVEFAVDSDAGKAVFRTYVSSEDLEKYEYAKMLDWSTLLDKPVDIFIYYNKANVFQHSLLSNYDDNLDPIWNPTPRFRSVRIYRNPKAKQPLLTEYFMTANDYARDLPVVWERKNSR